jgi:HPt (histidine-containing phosphotransfer) domain-containing protein
MSASWGGQSFPPGVPTLNQHRLDMIERDVSREFLIELVALFVSDVALRLERLSDAVKLRETAKAAAFAHALQGAAASLGVLRLRAVAQRLEELVEKDDWGASDATLARLISEFVHVRAVLSAVGEQPVDSQQPVRQAEALGVLSTADAASTVDEPSCPSSEKR